MDLESEHGLTMRHWLIRQISKKEIENLIRDPLHENMIQIPWNKQGESPSEEKLFRLWAERNGKVVHPDAKRSKLKDNFRNALHKSNDFDEMPELHELNKQSGNYRVYTLLSMEESKAKAQRQKEEKRLKKLSSSSSKHSPAYSTTSSSTQDTPGLPDVQPFQDSEHQPMDFTESPVFDQQQPSQYTTLPASYLAPHASFTGTNDSHPTMAQDESNNFQQAHASNTSLQVNPTDSKVKMLLKKLNLGNHCDDLVLFTIQLYYDSTPVQTWRMDLSKPIRFLYGDDENQFAYILYHKQLEKDEEMPEEFKFTPYEFPKYNGKNHLVGDTLKTADQGVTLRIDDHGNLYGKRLCQVRVYHFEQGQESERNPVKLERYQEKKLFSYENYIKELWEFTTHSNCTPRPSPQEVKKLYFGIVPTSTEASGLITLVITPEVVCPIRNKLVYRDQSTLIAISDPNSIDNAIRDVVQGVFMQ